jgi:phosphatidate cytidylyltransferase
VTRVLSGAALLAFAIAVVWFAPPILFLAVAELLLVGAFIELAQLAAASGLGMPRIAAGTAAALTSLGLTSAPRLGDVARAIPALDAAMMTAFIALASLTLMRWRGGPDALGLAAASVFPSLYLGLPIGAMVAVRQSRGREALFLLIVTIVVSDTAQYYTGRAVGRRALAPAISPKKTIEGAVGGFVFGALTMAGVGAWWLPNVAVPFRALLGVAMVALGIAGDLFESMLKRSSGVKDSSSLIPGHGGILDRIDALLFAAPVYYIVLKYV